MRRPSRLRCCRRSLAEPERLTLGAPPARAMRLARALPTARAAPLGTTTTGGWKGACSAAQAAIPSQLTRLRVGCAPQLEHPLFSRPQPRLPAFPVSGLLLGGSNVAEIRPRVARLTGWAMLGGTPAAGSPSPQPWSSSTLFPTHKYALPLVLCLRASQLITWWPTSAG
jgi:hypothetical protein